MTSAPAAAAWLPGAQQLELLRRLNLAGRPSPALVEQVLHAGTSDRGLPDLDLEGGSDAPAGPPRGGTPAVDPTLLGPDELLRVAVALLAEDLARAPVPTVLEPAWTAALSALPAALPLRRRVHVVGDPRLADPVREELTRRGRWTDRRGGRVVVLGTGAEQMLADAWVSRFLDEGAPGWTEWLTAWAHRDAVPARADLGATARAWSRRPRAGRTHVVLDPAALPRLLRCRGLPPPPDPVPGHAAELARRTARVLGVLVDAPRRELLVGRVLLPWLTDVALALDPQAAPPGVPRRLRPWLRRTAARVHADVLAGGYPVLGDPDRLLELPGGVVPSSAGALEVALAALLDPGRPGREGRAGQAEAAGGDGA